MSAQSGDQQDDLTQLERGAPYEDGELFDVVVVGGGPAGATAAHELACAGRKVLLLDRAWRTKPCGGAVPPQLLRDFAIPQSLLVARVNTARVISPTAKKVDIPVGEGFVGMVDRDVFDEWLRQRAAIAGAVRRTGAFTQFSRDADGMATLTYTEGRSRHGAVRTVRARYVIGADGALSPIARQCIPGSHKAKHVFAYHEIVKSPTADSEVFGHDRVDVYYNAPLSPDFYALSLIHI